MITIYKEKKTYLQIKNILNGMIFFNQHTASKMDERASQIIKEIDCAEHISKYKIQSRFEETVLDIDRLSAGCKTVLNVMYNPDKVFCMKECGSNALEILYSLPKGLVYSDYALIPFNMKEVRIQSQNTDRVIDSYEELKRWWCNEE